MNFQTLLSHRKRTGYPSVYFAPKTGPQAK